MSALRFAIFIVVALGVWAAVHGYVFWRLATVPVVAAHVPPRVIFWAAVALWASYVAARSLNARGFEVVGEPLELFAANWVGVVFLILVALVAIDLVTFGGAFWPQTAPALRGWAAVAALVLSGVALVQGLRPPVVREYEVRLRGLPRERDGLVLVAVSDLHLGTLIHETWMAGLIRRVDGLKPDVVLVVGDLVDSEVGRLERLLPVLRTLHAPLGVWAVTGNHEFYAGPERSVRLLQDAGYTVLQDRCAEVTPGLVLAGVDDLTARRQFGRTDRPIEQALKDRPPGGVILLSHSPLLADTAAAAGAGLMLSGHTHDGQIWPFNWLVRISYRYLGGRYEMNGMPLIVCRGTGTWGPRMRLWKPSELLRITLRAGG